MKQINLTWYWDCPRGDGGELLHWVTRECVLLATQVEGAMSWL